MKSGQLYTTKDESVLLLKKIYSNYAVQLHTCQGSMGIETVLQYKSI